MVAQPNLSRHKKHKSSDGKVTITQVPPPALVLLVKPKTRLPIEDVKRAFSLAPYEKYSKARFQTLEGEQILKTDYGILNPSIGSGLVISLSLMLI